MTFLLVPGQKCYFYNIVGKPVINYLLLAVLFDAFLMENANSLHNLGVKVLCLLF